MQSSDVRQAMNDGGRPQKHTPAAPMRGFESSLPIALLRARQATAHKFKPHTDAVGLTQPQWRVIRAVAAGEPMDVATLAKRQGTLGEVLSFNVGDLLPIEVQEPITVMVDGLPMIKGAYGVRNGRYAVKISDINHPVALSTQPADRGLIGPQYRERDPGAGEFTFEKGLP